MSVEKKNEKKEEEEEEEISEMDIHDILEEFQKKEPVLNNCKECEEKKQDFFQAERCILCFLKKKDVHNCAHLSKRVFRRKEVVEMQKKGQNSKDSFGCLEYFITVFFFYFIF